MSVVTLRIPYRIPFRNDIQMKVYHASNNIEDLKNVYHSFYHEKIWKDYYKMRAQFSLLNDEAPSKGEEKKCIHRSHENGKREILLEKISPFYLCCLQDMSLTIYKHFKTMLMFIVSYIHTPFSINGVTSNLNFCIKSFIKIK